MLAHVDADAFFASVLQRDNPKFRGKPLLALGMSGGTTVIAASYEAKRRGVKTGMRLSDARKLAPDALAVPSDFRATCEASQQLFAMLEKFCPGGVERVSPDEGYLCLVELRKRGQVPFPAQRPEGCSAEKVPDPFFALASTLQNEIHRFLDLPVSIGIAPTKTLAKMASKHRKPKGIFVIDQGNREAFLSDLPIDAIPGIGARLSSKLKDHSFERALDLAKAPQATIKKLLGKTGLELQAEVQGIPVYKVITEPDPPKSISRCRSFRATSDEQFLYGQLLIHLSHCIRKLRREEFECSRVGVWLRRADGESVGAERNVGRGVCEEALLIPFVRGMLEELIRTRTRYSQCGLILSRFRPRGPRQVELFEEMKNLERIERIQQALDSLRERFGRRSVEYGSAAAAPRS